MCSVATISTVLFLFPIISVAAIVTC
jgi:hypothetical protein